MHQGYAVIDVETTGLEADEGARILEVGVVLTNLLGEVTAEFETVLNPRCDLGRQDVHRISSRDALASPRFEEIAVQLAGVLSGRVIVAHNLRFEVGFLIAEFARAGVDAPLSYWDGVCTMQYAGELLSPRSRSLRRCCEAAGLAYPEDAHAAIADARITASLLRELIRVQGGDVAWSDRFARAAAARWGAAGTGGAPPRRRTADLLPRFSDHDLDALLRPGTRVAFTGTTARDHDIWMVLLQERGLRWDPAVTERTGVLGRPRHRHGFSESCQRTCAGSADHLRG